MANDKSVEVSSPSSIAMPPPLQSPSLPWRASSTVVTGLTGMVSRMFLYGFNKVETTGLQRFLNILDEREDVDSRKRGLLTGTYVARTFQPYTTRLTGPPVCNHISVYVIHSS